MSKKKNIIFLNRAYNDLDIQLSLIKEFAKDDGFNVRVIGYPCDGDMGSPQYHEAANYIKDKYGVAFETVLDKAPAPLFLRLLYKAERTLLKLKNGAAGVLAKPFHVGVLMIMRKFLRGDLPWLDDIAASWNPSVVIIDEAFVQKGRSYMIDKILREKALQDVKIYVVQTGQTTYLDAAPNKASDSKVKIEDIVLGEKSPARKFFVPSKLDQMAVNTNFPQEEPQIHGNLRMDRDWIKTLHKDILVAPYVDKQKYLDKLPKEGKPRVVFMLSKLGYGIRLDELKDTIRSVANMRGVACAIKPHTRGMKFDFMDVSEINDCVIVPEIPSAVLIEWADILLFTGSSIAFHAMVLDKRVGFLQNCQYIETAFDDGRACDKFDTLSQLTNFLEDWRENGEPEISDEKSADMNNWLVENVYGGQENGLTAVHYKEVILADFKDKNVVKAL